MIELKSATSGYASLSYELVGFVPNDLVENGCAGGRGDGGAFCADRAARGGGAQRQGARGEVKKKCFPRQLFAVSIQAAVGGKIIAREDISAMRKDVTGYLLRRRLFTKEKNCLKSRKRQTENESDGGRLISLPMSISKHCKEVSEQKTLNDGY